MKSVFFSLIIIFSGTKLSAQEFSTATMRALDPVEAFRLAVAQSEELSERGEGIAGLEAAERLIMSNFRPSVNFNGTQFWQDTPAPAASGTTSKPQAAVSIHQSVFAGMRDYLSAKAAKAQTESARKALADAKLSLYQTTARAYLDLLMVQQEIATRWAQFKITKGRIAELESREKIGRSRLGEVLAAQSQLAQDESQYLAALGSERVRQEVLKFITGLQTDIAPAALDLPALPNQENYLRRALGRPDVASKVKDLEAADILADYQAKQRWPALDFDGNYYVKRPAASEGINWDVNFTFQLPLYTGDRVDAQIDQASAAKRSAEYALRLSERQAVYAVREAYEGLKFSLSVVEKLTRALQLARANSEEQAKDYKLGLVTNLDVLSALNAAQQTQLQLEQARMLACLSAVQLEAAAGGPETAELSRADRP